ncbi:MAG: flagellar protein FliS [Desulfovibrio sp.]|nr:flagellar protein FliS [Desulfovibrio sp.]
MGNRLEFRQESSEESGWLLLRMYDEALSAMESARHGICLQDYGSKGRHISRAIAIFHELTCALEDREDPLARHLDSLYLLCTAKLLRASADMDEKPVESAQTIIGKLRNAVARGIPSMPKDGRRAHVLAFEPHETCIAS